MDNYKACCNGVGSVYSYFEAELMLESGNFNIHDEVEGTEQS